MGCGLSSGESGGLGASEGGALGVQRLRLRAGEEEAWLCELLRAGLGGLGGERGDVGGGRGRWARRRRLGRGCEMRGGGNGLKGAVRGDEVLGLAVLEKGFDVGGVEVDAVLPGG